MSTRAQLSETLNRLLPGEQWKRVREAVLAGANYSGQRTDQLRQAIDDANRLRTGLLVNGTTTILTSTSATLSGYVWVIDFAIKQPAVTSSLTITAPHALYSREDYFIGLANGTIVYRAGSVDALGNGFPPIYDSATEVVLRIVRRNPDGSNVQVEVPEASNLIDFAEQNIIPYVTDGKLKNSGIQVLFDALGVLSGFRFPSTVKGQDATELDEFVTLSQLPTTPAEIGANADLGIGINNGLNASLVDSPGTLNKYVTLNLLNSYAYVQEAPINGSPHYRKDGAWVAFTPFAAAGTVNYLQKITSAGVIGDSQIFDNGTNVGFNTDAPTNTIDVNGSARIRLVANAAGNFSTLSATGVLQYRTAAQTLTDIGAIGGTIAAGQVAFGTASNTIGGDNGIFWDNVNKRAGFGTITPTRNLEVSYSAAGNDAFIRITKNTLGNYYGLDFNHSTGNNWSIGYQGGPGLTGNELGFRGSDGAYKLLITQLGQVAIGTILPSAVLHVVGTTNDGFNLITFVQSGTGRALQIVRGVGGATRAMVNFVQNNAAGGIEAVLDIQQATLVSPAIKVTNDGDIAVYSVTGGGNMHAVGTVRIGTIANLGSPATNVMVPSATGVQNLRTVTEFRGDIGAQATIAGTLTNGYVATVVLGVPTWAAAPSSSKWIDVGSDIYRNSRVLIGGTSFTDSYAKAEVAGGLRINELLYQAPTLTTISTVTTESINMTSGTNTKRYLLGANLTINFSTDLSSASTSTYTFVFKQDATGGRTVAWNVLGTDVIWQGGVEPIISDGINEITVITIIWTGAEYLGVKSCGFNV